MLFLMVLVTVGLVVVQEMCSRLGVYTGKGLGGLLREQFSVRSSTFALGLLLVANAGLTVSEFAGVGAAFEIFGVSPYVSVPIAAVAVWTLTVFGTYSKAERLFLVLSLAFLSLSDRRLPGSSRRQAGVQQPVVAPLSAHPRLPGRSQWP